jgi:hypothetical protein
VIFVPILLAAAQAEPPVVSATVQPTVTPRVGQFPPSSDWSDLPELQYVRRPPDMEALSAFVRDEVNAGRCTAAGRVNGAAVVTLDLAVLVTPGARIRRIVPRAINCVTVEQYGSGLVSRIARDNLSATGTTGDTWFRTTLIFSWPA